MTHDTYSLQRDLMQRSTQDLPEAVCLTPQALLYYALQVEELGETASALSDAIHGCVLPTGADHVHTPTLKHGIGFLKMADTLAEQGVILKRYAKAMRATIAGYFGQDTPRLELSLEHAVELTDGAVDVAVVNAGFSLSLGLPARACYENVVVSNLSKANPETGIIDKYPDGKWIKGPAYQEPNLAAIVGPLLWRQPQ